ncbi:MAG: hypothetical protein K2Q10_12095, partial [Rhodospirillales bacterium]|nr:hypothetical protein [Rhodospirillales bacterium]
PPGIGEVHAESEYQVSRHAAPQSRPRTNGAASMAKQQSLGEDPEELRKAHLIEYLHRLAGSVRGAIGFDPVPLVLVAQPEVDGHFRKLYGEKNLWPQTLQRNPEALTTSQLHCHSFELVKDSFQGPRERALEHFNSLWGDASPKAATKPEEIVKAARYGRVDTLFVAAGAHLWGHYEEAADRVVAHGSPTSEDDDLLDYAAIETITKGGRVEVVTELPRGQVMAALLRY